MGRRLYISKNRIPNVTWEQVNTIKDVEKVILKDGIKTIDAISFGDEEKEDNQPIIGYWWILRFLAKYAQDNNYLPKLRVHAKLDKHRALLTRAVADLTFRIGTHND